MDFFSSVWLEMAVGLSIYLGLFVSVEIGYRLVKVLGKGESDKAQIGTMQAAVLALLGLLLGFSFAGAASRFIERQDLIVAEANAIGTAYLRADLLDEPSRESLRAALRTYTDERIALFRELRPAPAAEIQQRLRDQHTTMWRAAIQGVRDQPQFALAVLAPVNDVIDLDATRAAAARRHLPILVLGLLIVCAVIGVMTIGFGCGLAKKRHITMTSALVFLIGSALWTTIDLDHPRRGLITMKATSLIETREGMK